MSLEAAENARPGAVPADETPPPADGAADGGAEAAGTAADEGEPAELPETAVHGQPAVPGDPVELDPAELPEEVEPTELIGRAEPVDEAEALGPGHRRRGLLLAAGFAVAALAIVGGAIGTVGALTHGFKKPVTIRYHESAVFKLQTGDCVSSTDGQVVSVLPCSTPHQAEVFATFALPASAWPGTTAVRNEASSGCASRLTGYLNPQLAISLAQSYVFPNKVAWTAGTRTVICEVQAVSGQLTQSVRRASLPGVSRSTSSTSSRRSGRSTTVISLTVGSLTVVSSRRAALAPPARFPGRRLLRTRHRAAPRRGAPRTSLRARK